MGVHKFTNRASAALASGITNSATSLTVAAGKGALFPALAGGESFKAVIQKGLLDTDVREIVTVTARSTDTFTIVRAQEGTTGQAFATNDTIALIVSAGDLDNFMQKDGDTVTGLLTSTGGIQANGAVKCSGVLYWTGNQGLALDTVNAYFSDGANYATSILAGSMANYGSMVMQGYHVPGTWGGFRIVIGAGTGVYEFRHNGALYVNGTQLTSDRRKKRGIEPIVGALAMNRKLQGCTYYRDDMADLSGNVPHMAGLIAQDVLKVFPQAVDVPKDYKRGRGKGFLRVDPYAITAMNTSAINELDAQTTATFKEMRAEIKALRKELNMLKRMVA